MGNKWYRIITLEEELLQQEVPAVKEAWEKYQLVLKLSMKNNKDIGANSKRSNLFIGRSTESKK